MPRGKPPVAPPTAPSTVSPPLPRPAPVFPPAVRPSSGLVAFGIPEIEQEVAEHPERFPTIPIDLKDIVPSPFNPEDRELADPEALSDILPSVKEHGVLQAVLVCERAVLVKNSPELDDPAKPDLYVKPGLYVMLAGARRRAASSLAGYPTIPGVVRNEFANHRALIKIKFIENLGRKDLTPIAEAEGFQQLSDTGMSYQEMVNEFGSRVRSRGQISKRIKLLKLTDLGKQLVNSGAVTPDGALTLLDKLKNPESQDRALTAATSGPPAERVPLNTAIERQRRRDADQAAEAAAHEQAALMGLQEITPHQLWGQDAVLHRIEDEDEAKAAHAAGELAGVTITSGNIAYYRNVAPAPPGTEGGPLPENGSRQASENSSRPVADGRDDVAERQRRQDHADASKARKAACQALLEDFGQYRDQRRAVLIEILTDAILAVDVAKAALRLKNAGQWAGVTVSTEYELGQILSDSAAQPLALASALAACEEEAADERYIGSRPWPPAIQRHVRRMATLGYHTLTPYETEKLGDN